jgi:DNA-binding NtrC family response regulator
MRERMEALIEEMLDGKILLNEAAGEFEKIYIQKALERNGGHLIKTAAALGIHRNTLSTKLTSYGQSSRKAAAAKTRKRQSINSKKRSTQRTMKAKAVGR